MNPNIVTIICHDAGQQYGCYGAPDARTPHIDAFAQSGIQFQNTFSTAPQCSPARAALWTGRYSHANGVIGLAHSGFQNDLHPAEKHLAQILSWAGYATHLFGLQHASPSAERCGFKYIHPNGSASEVAADFTDFLKTNPGEHQPFYAHIGFFEAHRPFPSEGVKPRSPSTISVPPYLPDIPVVREDLVAMEASIATLDQAVGEILTALAAAGRIENTLILFTGDHGVAFPRAKMTLYDPGLQVPLLMHIPGIPGGRVLTEMISHIDVLPTLLELVDIPAPTSVQGCSFSGLLTGEAYTPNEAVFAEKTYHTYYDPMRSIRTARWKLIANFEFAPYQETSPDYKDNARSYVEVAHARDLNRDDFYHPPFELFDLRADPWEQTNLADHPDHQEIRDKLIRRLRRWMEQTVDPLLDGPMGQGVYFQRMETFKSF
jgi:arylsulfatase A-like enzyme